ncbi:hypothetical protein GU700_16495 [Methylobacterium sp. NI91]|nr:MULTISPECIES: hypothetical protein [unclassified Methylobacterium]QIJ76062.1 hypothetical protein CLZ_16490 [Methylobacterium sp. CLZ]QIJ80964.1 hypothetical protein GU700_16495 [Methylobacterium sp. NI91]
MGDLKTIAAIASRHGFAHNDALAAMLDPAELQVTVEASKVSRHRNVSSVLLIVFPSGRKIQTASEAALAAAIEREAKAYLR